MNNVLRIIETPTHVFEVTLSHEQGRSVPVFDVRQLSGRELEGPVLDAAVISEIQRACQELDAERKARRARG